MELSERSFKVRSGKLLKKIKEARLDSGEPISGIIGYFEYVNHTYNKYFEDDDKLKSRFNRLYSNELSTIFKDIIESKFGKYDKPKIEHPVVKDKLKATKKKPSRGFFVETPKPHKPKIASTVCESTEKTEKLSSVLTDNTDIVFSFDDTGSMSACRRIVRDLIDKTSAELLVACGDKLNVGVIIHGDYCDPTPDPCVCLGLSQDWVRIKRFLEEKRSFMGGDAPECYELVLRQARYMNWRLNANKVLVLIGDEIPHTPDYKLNKERINYLEEIEHLANSGIKIISVQAMNNRHANNFYETMAKKTGGHHLRLTQLNQTSDLIKAICYSSSGKLSEFEKMSSKIASYQSPAFRKNIDVLAGRLTSSMKVDGLTEFQMFKVDYDTSIRDYVNNLGITFVPGCGYYEFTKPETVQSYKKVVVQDRETEVFYPDADGRKLLRLPSDGSVRINPKNYDKKYRFFIQSTSYTRILKAGTTLLYDVHSAGC